MNPNWTLRDLVDGLTARGEADAVIAVRGGGVVRKSAAEIGRAALRLAAGLLKGGFSVDAAAAIYAPNSAEWIIARLAVGVIGGVAVAIDDLAPAEEAARTIRSTQCRLLFTTGPHSEALSGHDLGAGVGSIALDGAESGGEMKPWTALLAGEAERVALPPLASEAPAMILFTSGTTGVPKQFALTSRHVAANVGALVEVGIVGARDRVLLPLPLHHAYPLVVGLFAPLAAGAAVVLPEAATAQSIGEALAAARATVVVGVPRLYTALLAGIEAGVAARGAPARLAIGAMLAVSRACLGLAGWRAGRALFASLRKRVGPELRVLISGGAKLDERSTWRLEALGWEVFAGYGLAETASVFTGNRPGARRIGSEGTPLRGKLRIAEPDATGMGEIQLKGPNVFAGYNGNEEATRDAFTRDGWFRTGDLGHCDKDGFLYVTGRSKEMIVLGGGKKVFPEDVEAVYGASPLIREIAALEREGALVALVLPSAEAARAGRLQDTLRIAIAEIAQNLPSHRRLSGFAVVRAPLPRTRLGKYRRFLLREIYEQALRGEAPAPAPDLSTEDRALIAASPAREIWQILERRYAGRALSLAAHPQLDLGIDSLEAMALVLEIEGRLGVRIGEDVVTGAASVRELLEAIAAGGPAAQGTLIEEAALRQRDLAWLAPRGPALALVGRALHALNRAALRTLFSLAVRGAEGLPSGPLVLAPNHVSDLDPLAVAAALPPAHRRRAYWGGIASRLFAGPVRRLLSRAAQVFPVDEKRPGASIALGVEAVKRGDVLVWFPEEWRSPTGELQPFRPGIGHILLATGAPVVPVFIRGTFAALPRDRRIPRLAKISVDFGQACSAARLSKQGKGTSEAERIADGLRARVAALAEETGGVR